MRALTATEMGAVFAGHRRGRLRSAGAGPDEFASVRNDPLIERVGQCVIDTTTGGAIGGAVGTVLGGPVGGIIGAIMGLFAGNVASDSCRSLGRMGQQPRVGP